MCRHYRTLLQLRFYSSSSSISFLRFRHVIFTENVEDSRSLRVLILFKKSLFLINNVIAALDIKIFYSCTLFILNKKKKYSFSFEIEAISHSAL